MPSIKKRPDSWWHALTQKFEAVDTASLEAGRLLFSRECLFTAGVQSHDRLIPARLPEIAFIGRSNVGKSSLLNALTGRNNLARTSNTPGRTQQLNFFDLGESMTLVDLPGYGYAKVSKSLVQEWTGLMKDYLRGRPTLERVCVLIDSRHGLKDSDREMMKLLDECAVTYFIVLTKIDKTGKTQLEKQIQDTEKEAAKHPAAFPHVIPTSSDANEGIPLLRALLAQFAQK